MTDKTDHLKRSEVAAVFQQSWEYIRHAHTMFWQSFAALFTAMTAVVLFIYGKGVLLQALGLLSSAALALVGLFVATRVLIVLREHFVTINKIRRDCSIDDLGIILRRWKVYELSEFGLFRPETSYIVLVQHLYAVLVSACLGFLAHLFLMTPVAVLCAVVAIVVCEWWAFQAYKVEDKTNKNKAG